VEWVPPGHEKELPQTSEQIGLAFENVRAVKVSPAMAANLTQWLWNTADIVC
jgi:hypothetical protein